MEDIKSKICSKCGFEKPLDDFYKSKAKNSKYYYASKCKLCDRKRTKEWNTRHKEEHASHSKKYYLNNKDVCIKKMAKYHNIHKEEHKKYAKIYVLTRLKNDLEYKLAFNLRARLRSALKGNYKVGSSVRDLGCSIDKLKNYLESKFQPGMTWENYGRFGWHIDHIKPLSKFDLSNRHYFLEASHYTNLQPLWWNDNLLKSNKEAA